MSQNKPAMEESSLVKKTNEKISFFRKNGSTNLPSAATSDPMAANAITHRKPNKNNPIDMRFILKF